MSPQVLENLPPFLESTDSGVARAAELLRAGEIVALPTETVYGLAGDAMDENVVRKIFSIKGRPLLDPLIIHGLDADFLSSLAYFTPLGRKLTEACWPGPLTLVLKKNPAVSSLVTAGRDTVAVRAPAHPVARAVLAACGLPLAAPSANPFGYISPTRAEHVRASFGPKVPWIINGGACQLGLESTIVDVSDPSVAPCLLRPGPITAEGLAQILGQSVQMRTQSRNKNESAGLMAPGLLERHYSPRTPFTLLDPATQPPVNDDLARIAWVQWRRPADGEHSYPNREVFWLSENGDPGQAAHGLYELLRRLDEAGFTRIYCEPAPNAGLGASLNDRLRRAGGKG